MSTAVAMTQEDRLASYGITPGGAVTPAQRRRIRHKERHASAWQDRRPHKARRHDLAGLVAAWDAHWRKPEPPVPSEDQLDRIDAVRHSAPRNVRITWPKRFGRRG